MRRGNAKQREARRREAIRAARQARRQAPQVVYEQTFVRRSVWPRTLSAVWLILIGIMVGGFVIEHVEDSPTLVEEPVAAPAAPPRPPKVPVGIATAEPEEAPQTLSWAPYRRATEYIVQFHDAQGMILYSTVVNGNQLTIPSWPVGTARWIVWPVVNGYKRSRAIVNSSLTGLDNQP